MNKITFVRDMPLKETLVFESKYHEKLRLDLAEKQKYRNTPGSIFVWMRLDGRIAGETYGIPLEHYPESKGLEKIPLSEKRRGIYCFSNTILAPFQRRGLGTILKAHWLGLVADNGFETVYGHARPGASQALNAKFGATFLEVFSNWGETGEDYMFYRLPLKS